MRVGLGVLMGGRGGGGGAIGPQILRGPCGTSDPCDILRLGEFIHLHNGPRSIYPDRLLSPIYPFIYLPKQRNQPPHERNHPAPVGGGEANHNQSVEGGVGQTTLV